MVLIVSYEITWLRYLLPTLVWSIMSHVRAQKLLSYCKSRYAKHRAIYLCLWCIRSWVRGFLLRDNRKVDSVSCDILFLHPSDESFGLKRKQKLIDKLKESGVNVREEIALTEKEIFQQDACSGPFFFGRLFRCYEGYANWLRKKYNPKVIITDRNGSMLSPFLKSRSIDDPVTFHLAHSVLTAQSSRFGMLEYDYYCIYGKSSLEYLQTRQYTFGSCQLVLGGSILFDENFVLPPASPELPILFLGMGPELEAEPEGRKIYQLICDWQRVTGKKLYIRLHQRSKGEFWESVKQSGLEVLSAEPFQTSAARASLVLSPYTNAVVDAALLGRPVQLVSFPGAQDFLQVEKFFGPRVHDADRLDQAVRSHLDNYGKSLEACNIFAKYHLEHGIHSVSYVSSVLLELLQTGQISDTVSIG